MPCQVDGVCLQVLDCRFDAIVYVHHRKCGLSAKPAFVVSILQCMEEDLCRVVCGPIESIFLTGNDARISERSKVKVELWREVLPQHLVADLRHTVYSLWLQNYIDRCLALWEQVTTKYCNGRGDEDSAIIALRKPEGIYHSKDVHIDCEVRMTLAQGRKNASQVYHVVDVVLLDESSVSVNVCHIKLFKFARKVKLLFCQVCRDNIVTAQFFAERSNQRYTNLTLAPSN